MVLRQPPASRRTTARESIADSVASPHPHQPSPNRPDSSQPRAADSTAPTPTVVVLFDGVCTLCHGTVRWLIARDPAPGVFRFASLQSAAAQRALRDAGAPSGQPATIVPDSITVIDRGRVLIRSDAVIAIAGHLGWPWRLARVGALVPRPLRDRAYTFVAARRYRWFGREEQCSLASATERYRFLDADEGPASAASATP